MESSPQERRTGISYRPGLRLHELKGDRKGTWSVTVSGNWRVSFRFEGKDALDVSYVDYH
ncbi:MAG: type II toxin-antitoxin system RelE/ParE family toxin [Burkholderiales bacterium]|nr:type II toxin-antitoxin system RelE/ParE family toxin [Burkholderiales bacterium]